MAAGWRRRELLNSGVAHVGNVGSHGLVDFTALGDAINMASRVQSNAAAGEVQLSEPVYASVAEQFPDLEHRTLTVRGKEAPFAVRVLRV